MTSWRKLERETEKSFKHSKLPRKEKEHLTHWEIFSSTYLVLFVVKSLLVLRAFIVLKCVTLSVLEENLVRKSFICKGWTLAGCKGELVRKVASEPWVKLVVVRLQVIPFKTCGCKGSRWTRSKTWRYSGTRPGWLRTGRRSGRPNQYKLWCCFYLSFYFVAQFTPPLVHPLPSNYFTVTRFQPICAF